MIAYLDSSVLARAYLADEVGHDHVVQLLDDEEIALVTGTWTRIEVSGSLVRAGRSGRISGAVVSDLLAELDSDLSGRVTVLRAPQDEVEAAALELVRLHGLRAMDAWHLAVAELVIPALLEPGESRAFASRGEHQLAVARSHGFLEV